MYTLDPEKIRRSLKQKGFSSVTALAHSLGVHRNTINYFLAGRSILPSSVEKILETLDLSPAEAFLKKDKKNQPLQNIAPLVDQLHHAFPEMTFILFGSHAKGTAQKYSDWDIGVYRKDGLDHSVYRSMVKQKNNLTEDWSCTVDLINLNRADPDFLQDISKHWIFLTGRQQDWLSLQRKASAS